MNSKTLYSPATKYSTILLFLLFYIPQSHAFTLTNPIVKDMSQSYGYYLGQTHVLNVIQKKHPSLSNKAQMTKLTFDSIFLSSIENIDFLLTELDKNEWEGIKQGIRNQIPKIDTSNLTKQNSINFIEEVKKRALGEIESPVIETLLLFNPAYEKQPVKEFNDEFRQKFSSDGTGKAKGVQFSIEFPKSWASKAGNRPNIVRKFISENGRGFEMIMVLIKNLPLVEGEKVTSQDMEELLKSNGIMGFAPPNSIYKNSGPLTIEGQPGFWLSYSGETSRARLKVTTEAILYTIYYGNKMIQIQCQIGGVEDTHQKKNQKDFKIYEPLFDLVANSLVIQNIYK